MPNTISHNPKWRHEKSCLHFARLIDQSLYLFKQKMQKIHWFQLLLLVDKTKQYDYIMTGAFVTAIVRLNNWLINQKDRQINKYCK